MIENFIHQLRISGYHDVQDEKGRGAFREVASSPNGLRALRGDTSIEVTESPDGAAIIAAKQHLEQYAAGEEGRYVRARNANKNSHSARY